jgi:hypothetical protein
LSNTSVFDDDDDDDDGHCEHHRANTFVSITGSTEWLQHHSVKMQTGYVGSWPFAGRYLAQNKIVEELASTAD